MVYKVEESRIETRRGKKEEVVQKREENATGNEEIKKQNRKEKKVIWTKKNTSENLERGWTKSGVESRGTQD